MSVFVKNSEVSSQKLLLVQGAKKPGLVGIEKSLWGQPSAQLQHPGFLSLYLIILKLSFR